MNELKYDIKKIVEFLGGGIDETIIASLIGIFVSSVNDEFPAFAEAVAADDRSAIHKILIYIIRLAFFYLCKLFISFGIWFILIIKYF